MFGARVCVRAKSQRLLTYVCCNRKWHSYYVCGAEWEIPSGNSLVKCVCMSGTLRDLEAVEKGEKVCKFRRMASFSVLRLSRLSRRSVILMRFSLCSVIIVCARHETQVLVVYVCFHQTKIIFILPRIC